LKQVAGAGRYPPSGSNALFLKNLFRGFWGSDFAFFLGKSCIPEFSPDNGEKCQSAQRIKMQID
jgi:hypothetical protein